MMIGGFDMDLSLRLLAALAGGSAIGLERSFHGRPAGFRTHALVCLGSALLMAYGTIGVHPPDNDAASRIAQGVMTGIGFLGAGVIFKEGLSVHGLTTAASIWVTAGIGLLLGAGFWYAAGFGLIATYITLAVLRWAEDRMPHQVYVYHTLKFSPDAAPSVGTIYALLRDFHFHPGRIKHRLDEATGLLEYRVTAYTFRPDAMDALSARLLTLPGLKGFNLDPTDE